MNQIDSQIMHLLPYCFFNYANNVISSRTSLKLNSAPTETYTTKTTQQL